MPQMMPINWIFYFIFFILIFIMFNILNYYIFKIKMINLKKNNYFYKKKNWKW